MDDADQPHGDHGGGWRTALHGGSVGTAPNYRFKNATATRGLISSGEGSAEFLHPSLPTKFIPSNGFLLILNGWNLNRRMADTVGHDGTASTAVQLLQMRAPRQALMPAELRSIGKGAPLSSPRCRAHA